MNTSELVEWQRIDPENGLVEPWLTWPFMDEIKTWDLKGRIVCEFGAGRSTAWWRKKCGWVDTIEANQEWATQAYNDCLQAGLNNGNIFHASLREGVQEDLQPYLNLIPDNIYSLIVIDGIFRTEMIEWGIKHLQQNGGGHLFIDNLDQDFVWISPKAMELIAGFEQRVFIQPGHINHEGKPWNTRYVIIPAK